MKKVYEVVFDGFDGSTDETDHLIIWLTADSYEDVATFTKGMPVKNIFPTDYTTADNCADMAI